MATRGVFQLRKLTVLYCEYGGSSKGAREFIRHQIVDFANKTPAAEVVTELRPGRHPYILADYETGENKAIGVKNITPSEIMDYAMTLRNSSGRKVSSDSSTLHCCNLFPSLLLVKKHYRYLVRTGRQRPHQAANRPSKQVQSASFHAPLLGQKAEPKADKKVHPARASHATPNLRLQSLHFALHLQMRYVPS